MSDKAILEYNGEKYEFPVIKGTEDELAIDIKSLRSATKEVHHAKGYFSEYLIPSCPINSI